MTSLKSSLLRLGAVLSVPAAIVSVFPFEGIGFDAAESAEPQRPVIAFVDLDEADLARAMRMASAAWQNDANRDRRARAQLSLGELPEDSRSPSRRLPLPPLGRTMPLVSSKPPPWCPSAAAPAPVKIPVVEAERQVPRFSQAEMLGLE